MDELRRRAGILDEDSRTLKEYAARLDALADRPGGADDLPPGFAEVLSEHASRCRTAGGDLIVAATFLERLTDDGVRSERSGTSRPGPRPARP